MRTSIKIIASLLILAASVGSLLAGCNNQSANGTQPQGLPFKPSASDIAAVQNNPNIPADKKAGIIAAMQGSKGPASAPPPGFGPPGATKAQ